MSAKKPKERPFDGCWINTRNFVFYLAKSWGVIHRVQECVNKKTHKISPQVSFLSQFLPFHNTSIKTVAYLMHHGQNFKQNWQHWAIPEKILTGSGGWGYTFLIPLLLSVEFLDLWLCPRKFQRKHAFTPGNSTELCDTPWKFHGQKPRAMENTRFILYTPGNSTSFLIDPWNFCMLFLQYPWKFHVLNSCHCLDFFWYSPFWGVLAKNLPKSKSSLKWQLLLRQK